MTLFWYVVRSEVPTSHMMDVMHYDLIAESIHTGYLWQASQLNRLQCNVLIDFSHITSTTRYRQISHIDSGFSSRSIEKTIYTLWVLLNALHTPEEKVTSTWTVEVSTHRLREVSGRSIALNPPLCSCSAAPLKQRLHETKQITVKHVSNFHSLGHMKQREDQMMFGLRFYISL